MVWFGLVWFGLVWFGLVWIGLVWFGLVEIFAENIRVDVHARTVAAQQAAVYNETESFCTCTLIHCLVKQANTIGNNWNDSLSCLLCSRQSYYNFVHHHTTTAASD